MSTAGQSLESWAISRIQQLLPLDVESLKQIVHYTDTLPKDAAAEHLKNLLGDDAKALEFISSFNLRRQHAPAAAPSTHPDRPRPPAQEPWPAALRNPTTRGGRGGKKQANLHALPVRHVDGQGNVSGAYQKPEGEEDYVPKASKARQSHREHVANNLALQEKPQDALQMPLITDDATPTGKPVSAKLPPSAAGPLISDSISPKKATQGRSSLPSSPLPRAKVHISGGTAMHGASTTLSDLDSAIRSLEMQTNPDLSASSADDNKKRRCTCMARRHPLMDVAPNCLNCGKIVCVKEGLGPCTFCGNPLLSADEIGKVLRVLKDERGDERMRVNNAAQKKSEASNGKGRALTGRDFLAQVSSSSSGRPSPLSSAPATPSGSEDEAAVKAKAHRDKLLGFQANNARRTQIHDEAADFDLPSAGTNIWASPAERAQQLKRQQKVLREMQWNAKPDYEKRRVVASIDLKGRKVVKRMTEVEKPDFETQSDDGTNEEETHETPMHHDGVSGSGAFSNNPLAAGLIRPKAKEDKGKGAVREKTSTWQKVQMDDDDNEVWILDGGIYGGQPPQDRALVDEEYAFG